MFSFCSPEEAAALAASGVYDDSKLYPPGEAGPASLLRRLSDSNLPGTNFFGASIDSVTDDDDSDRRGSLAGSSGRRGSRLADLLDKRRNPEKKKRKKDKQGLRSGFQLHKKSQPHSLLVHFFFI